LQLEIGVLRNETLYLTLAREALGDVLLMFPVRFEEREKGNHGKAIGTGPRRK
jgi:hypothetical protein